MDCKLAKGLSSEQLAEIEKKAQGIASGGPVHFTGSGGLKAPLASVVVPPPPTSVVVDTQKMDLVRMAYTHTDTHSLPISFIL